MTTQKRRAGRQALDGATNVERCNITLQADEKAKLRLLGGSPWVRRAIRDAVLPNPAPKQGPAGEGLRSDAQHIGADMS